MSNEQTSNPEEVALAVHVKKSICLFLVSALLVCLNPSAAFANISVSEKKYSNCTALNKAYPGGVSKSAAVVNKGGKTKIEPSVNAKVYKENKSKDRDGDGIACEK